MEYVNPKHTHGRYSLCTDKQLYLQRIGSRISTLILRLQVLGNS